MKRLTELKVVDRKPSDQTKIFFGAYVEIEDQEGSRFRYRIVGADESDAGRNFISIDSPVAKALMGKTEGDEVSVRRPAGTTLFYIVSIEY